MTTPAGDEFSRRLVQEFSRRAFTLGRPGVRSASRTLAAALKVLDVQRDADPGVHKSGIGIPHYWAVFLHDGRGAVTPRPPKTFLVFFLDPRNDPRNRGGRTPVRAEDVRPLTRTEFNSISRRVKAARRAGRTPPAIILRSVKPARGKFFFENAGAMQAFIVAHRQLGQERFKSFLRRYLRNAIVFGRVEKMPPILDITLRL